MLEFFLEILFLIIVISIIWEIVKPVILAILGLVLIVGIIFLCIKFWKVALGIIIVIAGICFICELIGKGHAVIKKHKDILKERKNSIIKLFDEITKKGKIIYENRKWVKNCRKDYVYTIEAIDSILSKTIWQIESADTNNEKHKFKGNNIPYGRANVFLGYFKAGVELNEVYYYSCWPSKIEEEVREYGILIARSGIYISMQKNKEKEYLVENYHIPFAGLKSVAILGRKLVCTVINMKTMGDEKFEINVPDNIQELASITYICNTVINTEINHFLLNVQVKYFENEIERTEFIKNQNKIKGTVPYLSIQKLAGEFKNYMNGRQGGGYAAEYANNIIDRLKLKKVINAGQILGSNGRQKKNGADRIVNGVEVQTKYYKTGAQSVDAAFENGVPKYIRSDGSGKMMQIEVPREQYQEAVERMQQKINKGELKVSGKESAKDYVRKGNVTYRQAQNIACAGNIDSLKIDALGGIQCTLPGATMSMITTFVQTKWMTDDNNYAACEAIKSGIKVGITGTGSYVTIMQLKRAQIAQFDKAANFIAKSQFAKTKIGTKLDLNKVSSAKLISISVICIVKGGPDVYRAIRGKISLQQLIKNSTVEVAGMGGYVIGSLIPYIPDELGGIVIGGIARFVVKNRMDCIIEDDAVKMYRILKEEYLEVVGQFELKGEELKFLAENTICSKKLTKILRNMYASGEYQAYARYAVMEEVIIQILAKRKRILADDFYEGISSVINQIS